MANKYLYTAAISIALLASCSNVDDEIAAGSDVVELAGVEATISGMTSTRAGENQQATPGYIGRQFFVKDDEMVLTKFCRTDNPIITYSYQDIAYKSNENGAWKKTSTAYDHIYWTDNTNPHTLIGYSCPQAWANMDETLAKWEAVQDDEGQNVNYYGYFSSTTVDGKKIVDFTDNEKISSEDILLTYSDDIQAQPGGSVAEVHYKHALASVKVVVNIQNFASGDNTEDVKTIVSDLKLLEQPWKYMWAQRPIQAEGDRIATPGWGAQNFTNQDDGTVDIKTWVLNPDGNGTNRNKTFTFQSLVVPGKQNQFKVEFTVQYPKALDPAQTETKTYTATLDHSGIDGQSDYKSGVYFEAGNTTTINISLNHKDEAITIGAEYIDWEDADIPSQTNLSKYSTFLGTTSKDSVTIAGEEKATIDDATWLYFNNDSILVDIYGNDGSSSKPFVIKTAYQFLSFAYEVNNGRDFYGLNVKLDASLVLQQTTDLNENLSKALTSWIGIGTNAHPFNGTFLGTGRYVRYLKGAPLFTCIGASGKVEGLTLEHVLGVTSDGVIAGTNNGTICACTAELHSIPAFTTTYTGMCGTNTGTIAACGIIGPDNFSKAQAAICGTNSGTIIGCYAGIPLSEDADIANGTGKIIGCYFDKNKGGSQSSDNAKTTEDMQLNSFVTTLNSALQSSSDDHIKSHLFSYRAAQYPKVN